MVYSHIKYSDRAFMGSITSEERAEDSIEMARILFGADFVDGNCVILGNVNVNSPLVWDGTMTKSLRAYARANQAAVIVPFILGGAMGPVTNAGAIAQSYAETLAGCALTQLERKGAPVIFGNFLSSMSLRSGSPTFGTPEPAIGSMVIGQLARRLGCRCLRRKLLQLKAPGCSGDAGRRHVDAFSSPLRRQFRPAFGRLCRRAAGDVLREIHDGHGFLRGTAFLPCRRRCR